jgi:predicted amidophosphoribosyltransferase
MPFRFLEGFNHWDIIIKETDTDKEYAIKSKYKTLCPICFYPHFKGKRKDCHVGIGHQINNISFITGHFYETDYKGAPLNWFGKLLKDISTHPFKYSHELFKQIIEKKILDSHWELKDIKYATMVPTTNQQMEQLFFEVSDDLDLIWIPQNQLFIRRELTRHYIERKEYVDNKYFLIEEEISNIINIENNKSILIFDDVFNQGYTFGRIIELLHSISFKKFNLVSIARTVPKSFPKTFYFP